MNPLIDSAIEVVSRERRSIINLEKYKIYIKERDFFVSVELLKMPFNSKFRNIKQGKKISYNPLIAFKSRKKNESFNNRNVWIKNFTGKWEPVLYASKLMISATIKY
ncbi:MAG: hypothetical protein JSR00_07900 [Bacteroidetes bacterium]|nr:hypothetical protein [Bacteroidota bacterium]